MDLQEVMKIRLYKFLLISLLGLFTLVNIQAGVGFFPDWNFSGQKIHGPVKAIEEVYEEGKVYYQFNQNHQLEKKSFTANDVKSAYLITYNKDKKINKIALQQNGKVVLEQIANYGDDGTLTSFEFISPKMRKKSSIVILDERKNVKIIVFQDEKDGVIEWLFEFDDKNQLAKSMFSIDKKAVSVATFRCDERGNVVEAIRFNSKLEFVGNIKNEYKYDKYGNWIEKKTGLRQQNSKTPLKAETIVRNITYDDVKPQKSWFNWF